MIEILQEVTDWGKLKVNNGIYHVNSAGKLVAYQPNSKAEVQHLKVPSTQFSKARRKFKKIGEYEEQFDSDVIKVQGSNGNIYTIQDGKCSCPGYTYRGDCKHVKEHC
jgi:hypothetical protein|tara:strand:+ start:586 stop:909 length:324 start_codon:yes stop_codon:yes gene_type:complete